MDLEGFRDDHTVSRVHRATRRKRTASTISMVNHTAHRTRCRSQAHGVDRISTLETLRVSDSPVGSTARENRLPSFAVCRNL